MKHIIMIHVSPYEIDQYQTFIYQLRRALDHINQEDWLFIPYLNLSSELYDWENSVLNEEFFTNKFNKLNNIVRDKININSPIYSKEILGALSYKERFTKAYKKESKSFVWFDCDLFFPEDLLYNLEQSYNALKLEGKSKFIITPETTRLWDYTWDTITNHKWLTSEFPYSKEEYFKRDPYEITSNCNYQGPASCQKNWGPTKFASGWGNLLTSDIFDEISLEGLGHYGVDDTFIMFAMDLLNKKGKNYSQYILHSCIVMENNLFRENVYQNLVKNKKGINFKNELRINSEKNMMVKLKQFDF